MAGTCPSAGTPATWEGSDPGLTAFAGGRSASPRATRVQIDCFRMGMALRDQGHGVADTAIDRSTAVEARASAQRSPGLWGHRLRRSLRMTMLTELRPAVERDSSAPHLPDKGPCGATSEPISRLTKLELLGPSPHALFTFAER